MSSRLLCSIPAPQKYSYCEHKRGKTVHSSEVMDKKKDKYTIETVRRIHMYILKIKQIEKQADIIPTIVI